MKRGRVTEPLGGLEVTATTTGGDEDSVSESSRAGREKRKRTDSQGKYYTSSDISDRDVSLVETDGPEGLLPQVAGDANAGMAPLIEEVITLLGKCTRMQGRLKGRMRRNLVRIRELNLVARSRSSPPRGDEDLRQRVTELEEELKTLRGELENRETRILELHSAASVRSPRRRGGTPRPSERMDMQEQGERGSPVMGGDHEREMSGRGNTAQAESRRKPQRREELQMEDRIVGRVLGALEAHGLFGGGGAPQGQTPKKRRSATRRVSRRESSPSSVGPISTRPADLRHGAYHMDSRDGSGRMDSESGERLPPSDDGATVVRRRGGRNRVRMARPLVTPASGSSGGGGRGTSGVRAPSRCLPRRPAPARRRRAPRTAAVAIQGDKDKEGCSYSEILSKARQSIALGDLGIDQTRICFGATGGMLIEIHGPDNKLKADQLATRLREIVPEGAKVSRPMKMAELKLIGLDDSTTVEEVEEVVAREGACDRVDVKAGSIQQLRNRLGWCGCGVRWRRLLRSPSWAGYGSDGLRCGSSCLRRSHYNASAASSLAMRGSTAVARWTVARFATSAVRKGTWRIDAWQRLSVLCARVQGSRRTTAWTAGIAASCCAVEKGTSIGGRRHVLRGLHQTRDNGATLS